MTALRIDAPYHVPLPEKHDYGIAVIGCGTIVREATMPCYTQHGLKIVGCYDIQPQAAEALARRFNLPRVYRTLDEVAQDDAAQIVEIAVTPWHQFTIATALIAAGKHLLCQKPLSDQFTQAQTLVALAKSAGVKLAVNQQMRWDPAVLSMRNLLRQGHIGMATDVSLHASLKAVIAPVQSWSASLSRFELFYHSIHYLDSMRFLFGEPQAITCRLARSPLQGDFRGETKTITILDYASGLQALVVTNLSNPGADEGVTFRVLGTDGVITGTLGLLRYPQGEPDRLYMQALRQHDGQRVEVVLAGQWFPDAFIGPISSLMAAIQHDSVPETSGEDNLSTLRLIEAAYRSAQEGRTVAFAEMF